MFTFTFGLIEIVDHPSKDDSSIVVYWVHNIFFQFVEVELSNGHLRIEPIVENVEAHVTYPLEVPRTIPRKVLWIEFSHAALLLALPFSRPFNF